MCIRDRILSLGAVCPSPETAMFGTMVKAIPAEPAFLINCLRFIGSFFRIIGLKFKFNHFRLKLFPNRLRSNKAPH
jgi:hypothetical protein